jgi:hypothetical protein
MEEYLIFKVCSIYELNLRKQRCKIVNKLDLHKNNDIYSLSSFNMTYFLIIFNSYFESFTQQHVMIMANLCLLMFLVNKTKKSYFFARTRCFDPAKL